tara:strand:- start:6867 stop:8372 length:1506 start_codon:yes stop_codon:yes gene_type:complete
MSKKWFGNAFLNVMHDPIARLRLNQERTDDMFVEKLSILAGKSQWQGKVIQEQETARGYLQAKIRIPELYDHHTPEACAYSGKKQEFLKTTETLGTSEVRWTEMGGISIDAPVPGETTSTTNTEAVQGVSYVGKTVYVRFAAGGPDREGRMRDARFQLQPYDDLVVQNAKSCYNTAGTMGDWASITWDTAGIALLDEEMVKGWVQARPKSDTDRFDYFLPPVPKGGLDINKAPLLTAGSPPKWKPSPIFSMKHKKLVGPPGSVDWNGRTQNDLNKLFMKYYVQLLDFQIIITSTFRGPKAQATAVWGKLLKKDVGTYGPNTAKLFNGYYRACKGEKSCTIKRLTKHYEGVNPRGHMIGASVDMNSWKHSQPQVKRMLQAAKLLGCFVQLETGPPHVHITIASAKQVYKDPAKVSDGFDSAKLKALEDKWEGKVSGELYKPTFTGDIYRGEGEGTTRGSTAAITAADLAAKKRAAASAADWPHMATDFRDCTLLSTGKLKCP